MAALPVAASFVVAGCSGAGAPPAVDWRADAAAGGPQGSSGGPASTPSGAGAPDAATSLADGSAGSPPTAGGSSGGGAGAEAGGPAGDRDGSGASSDGAGTGKADAAAADGNATTDGPTGADGTTGPTVFQNTTIWIAGDSTVATHNAASATSVESWGWGGQFGPLFNGFVTVTNSAIAGRSVRTWLYSVQSTADSTGECILDVDAAGNPILQAHWTAMLNGMKSGDYLFIQFGINDGDSTCPRHVGSAAFKAAYGLMAQAATARGANPIFVTPVNGLNGCTWASNRGFLTETKDAAAQYNVPVVDLNARSIAYFQSLGCTATTALFADGRTHFTQAGAAAIAGLVAQGVRDLKIPLAAYLK
jgi:lysophospholipase L1-like esterase